MPLIFDQGSKDLQRWLDDDTWTQDLVRMLHPYEGELDCYAVKKEVGKVGNNSPDFIIPIDSSENKSNIANFFTKTPSKTEVKEEIKEEAIDKSEAALDNGLEENNAPMPDVIHPQHKRKHAEFLSEDDLPFRFVRSHIETRPLETIDVYTMKLQASDSAKAMRVVRGLRSKRIDLSYLKRIRRTTPSDDKSSGDSAEMEVLLCSCETPIEDIRVQLEQNDINAVPQRTKVSKWPALSQAQYDEWSTLWPLAWRVPAQRKVEMEKKEYEECEELMASLFKEDAVISALAYDPEQKQVIARAQDQRAEHPLKHAILELCSSVAALEVVKRLERPDAPSQYLMTNLWIFLTHEPCMMCTMALLHSRVTRVFYAKSMPKTGGMESNYGIHWRQELNHRFSVFAGWMESSATLLDEDTYV
ncbi:hypothetical protein MRB53_039797 [Persea americana]|nr:hypothetical protein MRB53_039797 [Persea americana]